MSTIVSWRCPVCHQLFHYKNSRRGRRLLADTKKAHGQREQLEP